MVKALRYKEDLVLSLEVIIYLIIIIAVNIQGHTIGQILYTSKLRYFPVILT